MADHIQQLKDHIITIGRLLWEKDLVSGLNGNISARVDEERILLTATGSCLGMLQEEDILLMRLSGEMIDEGKVSTEKLLHTEIYKNFKETAAVIHTHLTYTNAYFLENAVLKPRIFETRIYLGEVTGVPQNTPAVTDAAPVIDSLKRNNIVALRNHGVVAMGLEHFDCFLLIQALEEAAKIDAISRLYTKKDQGSTHDQKTEIQNQPQPSSGKKYALFSSEQIADIVKYVNEDPQMAELGQKTNMTMDLAVKLDETGKTYSFRFKQGRISEVGNDENAEFLINAPEKIWRAVFNREIDPFVATTQKKMHLRGDFAKISKWYAPCSRVFELWSRVPVE
ncbi:MAG: class II aldolase/adducin family protein [Candidatus Omnitrophica bacterium]|nr:class II aldolase/adducin family protein [Candidatus Omnitrophota bacterium]